MSNQYNYNTRTSAGQRPRVNSPQTTSSISSASTTAASPTSSKGSKERLSLEDLVADIDSYIAESTASSSRTRSNSRGTMFVDFDESGEMSVQWRNQKPDPVVPAQSAVPAGLAPPRRARKPLPDVVPDAPLSVVEDAGYEDCFAPRSIEGGDGVAFVRVGFNAAGRGIYINDAQDRMQWEYDSRRGTMKPELDPCYYAPTFKEQVHPRPLVRRAESKPLPAIPLQQRWKEEEAVYPRPLVPQPHWKPLPPLPQGKGKGKHRHFSVFQSVKKAVRSWGRNSKTSLPRRDAACYKELERAGYIV